MNWTDALLLVDVLSAASSHQESEHGPAKLRQFFQLWADLQLTCTDVLYTPPENMPPAAGEQLCCSQSSRSSHLHQYQYEIATCGR